jgi:hypothetical protein
MVANNPREMRPGEVVRLLNSTPLGEVITERQLYRHRTRAGAKVGTGKTVDLLSYFAWLVHQKHQVKQDAADYEAVKEKARARQAAIALAGRDIGPIPDIVDVERREACRFDLKLFCETYNPEAFYFGWSDDHIKSLRRIEEGVLEEALLAWAMPRGSGKTTICRMACLWGSSYGHVPYGFIIGANSSKAADNLDAVKTFMRFLPKYGEDFPEIAFPIRKVGGIANRAAGQLCQGMPTNITWTNDRIALPCVPLPSNWPEHWPVSKDGTVPTSGVLIGVSGLTGDGIRGSVFGRTNGEQIRPSFVLLDDPQTDESARSLSQNETRERLISQAVLGMAAPGESISAVMPCTVIQPDDMVDRMLSRKKHPLWRGERFQMMRSMPTNLKSWEPYFSVYRECAQKEPPNFQAANDYYVRHRDILDEGAEPSWTDRKSKKDISATQHAMNILCRDEKAFWAEYQNDPLPDGLYGSDILTADQIAAKVWHTDRGVVPEECEHVTMFVDVQKTVLYWMVCGWADNFTGTILDYGIWPEQNRPGLVLKEALQTMSKRYQGHGLEGQIHAALEELCEDQLSRHWVREDGAAMKVSQCLVDANWGRSTETVYNFCRSSRHSGILLPSHGRFVGASSVPFSDYKKARGERVGQNWRIPSVIGRRSVRHVLVDINYWKSFVHQRFGVAIGDAGCLSLFGGDDANHHAIANQLTAEYAIPVTGRGRTVDEWKERPDRPDNHLLDCLVGCAVGGSMRGASLEENKANKPSVDVPDHSMRDLQRAARDRHRGR